MNTSELLLDLFERVAEQVPGLVLLSPDDLAWRPGPEANSIGWLVWHLARVQDDHLAGVAAALDVQGEGPAGEGFDGGRQVWDQGWRERLGLPYESDAIGYGHSTQDVAAFQLEDPSLLAGYYAEVHEATRRLLPRISEQQLDTVVDENWDPPVTAGVRLVSVVNDVTQHLGQAAYIKGLLAARA